MGASIIITTLDGRELQVSKGMNRRWFLEYDRIVRSCFPVDASGRPLWYPKNRRQFKYNLRDLKLLRTMHRKLQPHVTFTDKAAFLRAHLPIWHDPCLGQPEPDYLNAYLDAPFRSIRVAW